MKTLLTAIIFTVLTSVSSIALAGPGDTCHFHGSTPAAESTIIQCATQRKATLIQGKKLDKSWEPVTHTSISLVDGKKGKEWKVVFNHPQATDQSKTNLFMFFTPPGNFIAANYSGL